MSMESDRKKQPAPETPITKPPEAAAAKPREGEARREHGEPRVEQRLENTKTEGKPDAHEQARRQADLMRKEEGKQAAPSERGKDGSDRRLFAPDSPIKGEARSQVHNEALKAGKAASEAVLAEQRSLGLAATDSHVKEAADKAYQNNYSKVVDSALEAHRKPDRR